MQRGTIVRHRASWTLLYWDLQFREGKRKRVRVSKKLAKIGKEYPSKASVRLLADEILAPLNRKQLQPESSLKVFEYINDFYFPSVESDLRPATIDSYKFVFNKVKKQLDMRLRDFRTVHGQRLLRDIKVGRRTLIHIKAFLSAVFKHAKQQGVLDGLNPMVDVSVPGRPTRFKGRAYTMSEVARMLEDLELTEDLTEKDKARYQTASDVIGVLSMTGLRQSECRGIRWSDWDEQSQKLNVQRSVWETKVGPTKNVSSENAIPIIPLVRNILEARRTRLKAKPGDYIFAGERRGTPLNFHNLENRVIKPALENAKLLTLGDDDKWTKNDKTGIEWKGFHGFRRGLASNLFGMGINPKLIAAILRHSDMTTTLELYTMIPDNETREALEKLETKFNANAIQMDDQ
jgi:integrase